MKNTPARPFRQVDVFTDVPFRGNPVAVVLDADGLTTGEMQTIANWTNLSETTFVCSPTLAGADYKLRIFTPKSEIPFAGHPTIGSAWALLERGLKPGKSGYLVQECGKGLVTLRLAGKTLFLELPEAKFLEMDESLTISAANALGLEKKEILRGASLDVGPVWLTLQLPSAQRVMDLKPDMARISMIEGQTGITVFGLHQDGKVEVRSFAPAFGVPEDPVCGSGNGCVAALIRRYDIIPASAYVALQGRNLGRDGRVEVEYDAEGTIWVGGNAVTCIAGSISL